MLNNFSTNLIQARQYLTNQEYEKAYEAYTSLLQEQPTNAELYLELSSCMISLGQLDQAVVIIQSGLQFANGEIAIASELQLAQTYQKQGRNSDAARIYSQLLSQNPVHLKSALGLSAIHLQEGCPSKAIALLEPLLEKHKDDANFLTNYCLALSNSRHGDKAIKYLINQINGDNNNKILYSNAMLLANYLPTHNENIAELSKLLIEKFISQNKTESKILKNKISKIGFFSADFNMHPVGYFILGLIKELHRLGLKIFAYSNSNKFDSITQSIQTSSTTFISVQNLTDSQIKNQIQSDDLDILIDLSGHTDGNRLDLFTQRLCPIQATYLGFMESTGITNIDYLITDQIHTPINEQSLYAEKVIYLPQCRFNFSMPNFDIDIAEQPYLENGYLTFGCFSNTNKLSDECLELWASTLKSLPTSRLKLRHKNLSDASLKNGILETFMNAGVAPGRIEFYSSEKYDSYLNAYSEVDVMLDTFPFSGATTSCESLWMGVPVLTLNGEFPAARQTTSILKCLSEVDWIAQTKSEYLSIAVDLPNQINKLVEFRKNIRQKMQSSTLMNSKAFAKDFIDLLNQQLTT